MCFCNIVSIFVMFVQASHICTDIKDEKTGNTDSQHSREKKKISKDSQRYKNPHFKMEGREWAGLCDLTLPLEANTRDKLYH